MKKILGIDPGLSGALALYTPATDASPVGIEVIDMPTHEITVNKRKKKAIDLYALATWLDVRRADIRFAVIEDVHSMPAQGVTSSFNFGFAAGSVQGAVAANLIPMRLVRPSTWKANMGLTADKDSSRRLASQKFPAFAALWARKMDDGRAEAVLLAVFGLTLQ